MMRISCAIYTRKSSEEGLDKEFNSLDAQREACEAFTTSQKHAGWITVRDLYDDGGLSGGTIERPALQRLKGFELENGELIDCCLSLSRQFFDCLHVPGRRLLTLLLFLYRTCHFPFDFFRKGRIGVGTGTGNRAADLLGLTSRIAGLWVVGAPIEAPRNSRSPP